MTTARLLVSADFGITKYFTFYTFFAVGIPFTFFCVFIHWHFHTFAFYNFPCFCDRRVLPLGKLAAPLVRRLSPVFATQLCSTAVSVRVRVRVVSRAKLRFYLQQYCIIYRNFYAFHIVQVQNGYGIKIRVRVTG